MYALAMLMVFSLGDVNTSTERPMPQQALRAGVAAARQHDWPAAQHAFEQAANASSDESVKEAAALGVAESLFRQGQYQEAGDRFESWYKAHAITERPASALIALRWAQCLAHQARWHDAAKVAQQALTNQTDPSLRIPFHYLLGRCYTARGMYDEARRQYFAVARSANATDAIRARALWMIAHSYASQGEVETARETFMRVEEKSSADPRLAASALVEAGRCNELRGQWKEAEATYRQAVAKYAGAGMSGEAGRRLAVVQIRISQQKLR